MKLSKRCGIDFSKHELKIEENEYFKRFTFKVPDTIYDMVVFTIMDGHLVVTGDYGSFVFNRAFTPFKGNYVSDRYFCEKLHNYVEAFQFDKDETEKEIIEKINDASYYVGEKNKTEYIEWLEELKTYLDDKLEYEYQAYRNMPSFIDCEDVPYSTRIKPQLLAIFDAFDEICERI